MDEVLDSELLGTIASMPVPADLLKKLQLRLQVLLPQTSDRATVAARLQRFIAATRSPTSLLAFFDRDETSLETLLRLLGAGERLSDQLIADPESFDLVRASGGGDVGREILVDEIVAELDALAMCGSDYYSAQTLLRSVAGRERLRIAYAEFVTGASIHRVSAQLTVLAEAIIESALHFAGSQMSLQFGWPRTPAGDPGRLSVIGLGPFGGRELGYYTPLQWMFLCDLCGPTDGHVNLPGDEFFRRLCLQVIALVRGAIDGDVIAQTLPPVVDPQAATPMVAAPDSDRDNTPSSLSGGSADKSVDGNRLVELFAVSIARCPAGNASPIVTTVTEAYRYYQLAGRTWERLLHVKSRVVAGDEALGNRFLELIAPWVYRRYLQRADWEGLQTLMRKFSRRLAEGKSGEASGVDALSTLPTPALGNIRFRDGGLNDIESVIGLLQVINGGDLPELRVRDTADAIQTLLASNCLTVQEAALLSDHYQLLRRFEHCFQIDQTSTADHRPAVGSVDGPVDLPFASPIPVANLAAVAWNLGYRDATGCGRPQEMLAAMDVACDLNRQTIARLLADADIDHQEVAPETELVLDPNPDDAVAAGLFLRHGMSNPGEAMSDLQRLAAEPVPFLSSRRCRHFLASIAPDLLNEVGKTPDPHQTLRSLADVSDSLGGKAVLWELFGASPAAMSLFVRLCACSPYLTEILIRNPGMVDELVDSLILDRLPSDAWLEASSIELCRSAADIRSVLQSFKNGSHLQIGVRDCLGKESLESTHAALASTAEAILRRTAESVLRGLAEQFGDAVTADGKPVEMVILALGKLGAKEPNYHSDLQALFLYTDDCQTRRRVGGHRTTTTTAQFFGEAATRTASLINDPSSGNRLYELGTPLQIGSPSDRRPALSMDALAAHFRRGQATLPQRLALCKARAISGNAATRSKVDELVRQWIAAGEWFPMMARQINELRAAMESSAADDNLKRAAGGTVDVELITQALQLCHAKQHPEILVPGTLDALHRITDAGLIDASDASTLQRNYRTLREVESKLRLLNTPRRHEIPADAASLDRLAFLMGQPTGERIVSLCRDVRASNRRLFNSLIRDLS